MTELSILSPYVREVLANNHFEPLKIFHYGPRFVCLLVRAPDTTAFFKMILPVAERAIRTTNPDYIWTEADNMEALQTRLIKETLFLQYFSQQLQDYSFEPQMIAMSEQPPVWSLRNFIDQDSMAEGDSSFVFRKEFYKLVRPRQVIDFFQRLHRLSPELPEPLRELATDYVPLTIHERFEEAGWQAYNSPKFVDIARQMKAAFRRSTLIYTDFERVVTHYEPYSCHLFIVNHQICFIDWENVAWGHRLQDLSVFWMRMIDDPAWQAEYLELLDADGYFEGTGRQLWENEIVMQGLANVNYLYHGGQFGTPAFTARAIKFFEKIVRDTVETSDYFRLN